MQQTLNAARIPLKALALQKKERGLAVGKTESGKSTLAERLITQFLDENPTARILIADSKPRFRAEWTLDGVRADWKYRKWEYGAAVPGSFLLPLRNPESELANVWRLKGHVAIAQVDKKDEWWKLAQCIDIFYEKWGAKWPRLVYVDEAADFYEGSVGARTGNSILRVIRSGRERNVAFLGASQRPRGLPKSFLTEVSKLYLFELDWIEDVKHLRENGLGKEVAVPQRPYVYYFFDKRARTNPASGKYYQLAL